MHGIVTATLPKVVPGEVHVKELFRNRELKDAIVAELDESEGCRPLSDRDEFGDLKIMTEVLLVRSFELFETKVKLCTGKETIAGVVPISHADEG